MGQTGSGDKMELQEAIWYRWTGGQPGVRGFYFRVQLSTEDSLLLTPPEIYVNDIKIRTEKVDLKEDFVIIYGYYLSPREEKQVNMTEQVSIKSIEVPNSGEIIFNLDGNLRRIKIPEFKQAKFERE